MNLKDENIKKDKSIVQRNIVQILIIIDILVIIIIGIFALFQYRNNPVNTSNNYNTKQSSSINSIGLYKNDMMDFSIEIPPEWTLTNDTSTDPNFKQIKFTSNDGGALLVFQSQYTDLPLKRDASNETSSNLRETISTSSGDLDFLINTIHKVDSLNNNIEYVRYGETIVTYDRSTNTGLYIRGYLTKPPDNINKSTFNTIFEPFLKSFKYAGNGKIQHKCSNDIRSVLLCN